MRKKILVINVNWVGDVLFSTPFIRALRDAYPDSYLACLLHPRCLEVLEENPRLNEIIIYDEEGAHRGLIGKAKLILTLRRKRFDTAFVLHRSFTKALIAFLSGAKRRVGYATKRRGFLLTDLAEDSPEEVHKVEYFLNILKAAGIEAREKDYEFFFGQSDREYVKKFLSKNGVREEDQIFVINPGGNWDPKRWPKGNYAEVADRLIDDYKAKVVITGAAKDVKLAEDIASAMKKSPVIACGATTLKQLAALLERADLVIANDTGPMHIGVAVGSDVIALFGPTSPAITGPCGKGRYKVITRYDECEVPCYDLTCADNRCMKAIRVEDVLREVAAMLSQKSKVKSQNCNSKLKT